MEETRREQKRCLPTTIGYVCQRRRSGGEAGNSRIWVGGDIDVESAALGSSLLMRKERRNGHLIALGIISNLAN
jgi:hypothetical protein